MKIDFFSKLIKSNSDKNRTEITTSTLLSSSIIDFMVAYLGPQLEFGPLLAVQETDGC
jgi:hypothetical protein